MILFLSFSFIPAENDSNRSNMAVMEIYLPSGFVVDTDTLPTLESSDRIKVCNPIFNLWEEEFFKQYFLITESRNPKT